MNDVYLALAGNPNSGKTTLFNLLTGSRQRVGNYPGITVDRKEGSLTHNNYDVSIVDLPGCYSLTSYTPEEYVARNVLTNERPQSVVHVMDATTLERGLFLTVQFLELGVPVVIALNMMDEARKQGLRINSTKLSKALNLPVVETVARKGKGKNELLNKAVTHAQAMQGEIPPLNLSYGADIDQALDEMVPIIQDATFMTEKYPARWIALKYLEQDSYLEDEGREVDSKISQKLEDIAGKVDSHCEKTLNTHPEAIIADYRYGFINSLLKQGIFSRGSQVDRIALSDKMDLVLTNRLLGPMIMLGVLYGLFYATFSIGEIPMGWLEAFFGALSNGADAMLPDGLFKSMLISGVIDGVGGVMGFVPLIMVMFMALTFLEDAGYMARIAYMMDRVLRIFGLHGCSVMPFLISGGLPGGCAVPGVMATRTLRSPKEKLATLLTAPFMACGAKVPVFILLAAAFFPGYEANVMFCITLFAWTMALIGARLLRSTVLRGAATPFVMELPPYRMPTFRGLMIHTWERSWEYIKKAGTVILAISILIWAAMTFPGLPEDQVATYETKRSAVEKSTSSEEEKETQLVAVNNQEAQAALQHSLAGQLGTMLEPISELAGFDWRTNIALLGGVAAKEVIVSSLGTAYSLGEVDPEETENLSSRLLKDPSWSIATALSLMVFVLLYAPCFVTMVAMAKEASWKWAAFSMGFNTLVAFVMATAVYQVTSALS